MLTEKQLTHQIIKNLGETAVVVVLAIIAVSFIGRQISHSSNSLHQRAVLAKILENRSSNALLLEEKITPLGDIDAQIESAFPTVDNILDFVSAIESLASQSGVEQTLHFDPPIPIGSTDEGGLSLSSVDYTATLTAPAALLSNYLKNFESLPFFAKITSINIASGSDWDREATINLKARLYIRNK